jgi:shikimate kinase
MDGLHSHSRQYPPKLIVLTGFRATGKSSVAQVLAHLFDYRCIDTDALVEARLGCSIAESVHLHGWRSFREIEENVLRECSGCSRVVLATGGGAILHEQAWRQLRDRAVVIWLQASLQTVMSRIGNDDKTVGRRPSLTGQAVEQEIPELLAKRDPLYRTGSDLVVSTEGVTPEELAESLYQRLR